MGGLSVSHSVVSGTTFKESKGGVGRSVSKPFGGFWDRNARYQQWALGDRERFRGGG